MFAEPDPDAKNVWAMFLEKLWAKINVNFERTSAGWQHEVIRVFTGAGAKDFIVSQLTIDELWDIMYDNHQKDYILGCGTTGEGDHNF